MALAGSAHLAVRAGLRVPGFPAGTAEGITTLTPVSLAADVAAVTVLGFVGVAVYLLLRRIDRCEAGALIVLAAVAAGMILVNLAFHHAALLVATGPGSTRPDGLVGLLLDLHDRGYTVTGAFLACCCSPWATSPTSPACSPAC